MSVPVEIERLREQIAASGAAVFLISVRDGSRPHVVSAEVAWDGDHLVIDVGARTASNAAEHPAVTLLWPAAGQDYSLLVDGTASVDGSKLSIEPTSAVLHRSVLASAPDGHHDGEDPRCKPVLG